MPPGALYQIEGPNGSSFSRTHGDKAQYQEYNFDELVFKMPRKRPGVKKPPAVRGRTGKAVGAISFACRVENEKKATTH